MRDAVTIERPRSPTSPVIQISANGGEGINMLETLHFITGECTPKLERRENFRMNARNPTGHFNRNTRYRIRYYE